GEVRGVASWLVAVKHRAGGLPAEQLGRVQQFLQRHEDLLPVRAVWLAALAGLRLSHGDVLGLTRTRDRLLEPLYRKGLAHGQDVPSFLRFSGIGRNERLRAFRDWLLQLPHQVEQWVHRNPFPGIDADPYDTNAYAELMLAFGLARLGEDRVCRGLMASARKWLDTRGAHQAEVHKVLLQAFDYRIHQALAGKPAAGPLPQELLEYVAKALDEDMCYKVNRMRMRSRILEPHETINAFHIRYPNAFDDYQGALVLLPNIIDRSTLEKECIRLQKLSAPLPTHRLRDVAGTLKVAPRLPP